jgi:hypothetical protein
MLGIELPGPVDERDHEAPLLPRSGSDHEAEHPRKEKRMREMLLLGLLLTPVIGADKKGTIVTLDGLSSIAPAAWVKQTPKPSPFVPRLAQFSLPKVKADKEDAELVVYKGIGGSAEDNINRWKAQFKPPEGKTIDDISTVQKIKIAGHAATVLDIQGTFGERPEYRMIAIQFQGPENVYHIKLTGPARTIEQHKKDFDAWYRGFKKK